ncbi:hypothetical protein ABT336_06960 [Micromonospora sp. NPDC000207]|uniref:hypothetical protein n=1 Tax=Micromonospora sp. NPDC000207 TaxID=3154246 RepID=UPI00331A5366
MLFIVVAALLLMAVRYCLVVSGLLFGSTRIVLVDVALCAVVLLVATVAYRARIPGRSPASPEGSTPAGLLGIVAALLGLPALVGSLLNFVAPPTPAELPLPACPAVQTYDTAFRGVTNGPTGNFARSGPGLAFPQTDRFTRDCVVGFTGYCIGDPVQDPIVPGWVNTRWLLAARHENEPSRTLARWLSGEPAAPRFLSNAYLVPQSPDEKLRHLGDRCPDGLPLPGRASLTAEISSATKVDFEVEAAHAFNIGIAVMVLDPDALRSGTATRQVLGSATKPGGTAGKTWDTGDLTVDLRPDRPRTTVVALAVPCLDPLAPAPPDTAATLAFEVSATSAVKQVPAVPALHPDQSARLRAMACDTQSDEAAIQQGEGQSGGPPE